VAALLVAASAPGQQQAPSESRREAAITLVADLVPLSITVTDRAGRSVAGLGKGDFKIYDNDVEQPIAFFDADVAPVSWGLILDRSASMTGMMRDVYQAASHVLDEGTASDEAFVATFDSHPQLECDFVSDRHRLENSLLSLRPGDTTALWDSVAFGLDHAGRGRNRKKVLVVVTDGDDNASTVSFRALVERAENEGVLIYTVGMFEPAERYVADILGTDKRTNDTRFALERLATATGATSHVPSNVDECKEAMKQIARDVRSQYSLGFYPTGVARDGKWHSIRVAMAGQASGQVARTRPGYYAAAKEEEER